MILVLGGTTEGRELALELMQNGYPCLLSVATELGAKMVDDTRMRIRVGELDAGAFEELLRLEKIRLIIDATHPYAVVVKKIAYNAAKECGIIYARFERPLALLPDDPAVIAVKDYTEALEVLRKDSGGIFFTIGVRNLFQFKALWEGQERSVWVKIYPGVESLKTCQDLGLQPEQIFAFHGPGNKEILKGIIAMTGISWIVTKESGSFGGVDIKISAAMETGTKALVITRPLNEAGLVFQNINEVKEFVREQLTIEQ